MTAYFIRRLLLVPITFLAITFLVYAVVRILPGGPVEQAEMRRKLAGMAGEGGGGVSRDAQLLLDEDSMRELQRFYALDQPIPVGYLQWLGVLQRDFRTRVPDATIEKNKKAFEALKSLHEARVKLSEELDGLLAEKNLIAYKETVYGPLTEAEAKALDPALAERARSLAAAGMGKRDELLALLDAHRLAWGGDGAFYKPLEDDPDLRKKAADLMAGMRLAREELEKANATYGFEVDENGTIFKVDRRRAGILQGEFGTSYTHSEPVLELIYSKLPISATLGICGLLLTWLICVPLGIAKALRHRSAFDNATSFIVFVAYAIPGYVVCMLLLVTVAAHGWLPLGGWGQPGDPLWERIRYMIIPVVGYTLGSFAAMTILTKNSLMENLSADYVRTALAKGLTESRTVWAHAFRNSLIPLTANLGSILGIVLAGSFLIEKVTNVDGMGLLGYTALLQRDYPIVLGILVITVTIQLIGSILSDLIWAALDPRIRFEVKS